jgi:hypothetical protein
MRLMWMALCVVVCVSLAVGETLETQVYDVPLARPHIKFRIG